MHKDLYEENANKKEKTREKGEQVARGDNEKIP